MFRAASLVCGPEQADCVTEAVLGNWLGQPRGGEAAGGMPPASLALAACQQAAELVLRGEVVPRGGDVVPPGGDVVRRPHPAADELHPGDAEDRAESGSIVAAIGRLPEPEREALIVTLCAGCTYEETAAALGEDASAVASTLRSALCLLAAQLDVKHEQAE